MKLCMIVAMTEQGVIGRQNKLPWHLPEDLKRFKALTMGHPIIMGRKTFESIGRPLPGRESVVITRDRTKKFEGATVVHSLDEALNRVQGSEAAFVIGGAEVFREALPRTDRIYLTMVHENVPGDVYFPDANVLDRFDVVEKTPGVSGAGEKIRYSFITGDRRR